MKTTASPKFNGVPESFLTKFGKPITAILEGFDRIRFRATQRLLFQPNSMESYLASCGVLIKHFKSFAEGITQRVKAAAYREAEAAGRPVEYLGAAGSDKESLARELARKDRIREGLIAVFTAVEPCLSYSVRGDHKSKQIHLVSTFKSVDVLRFLGHFVPSSGRIPKGFRGEVTTRFNERPEGVRLRHTVKGNSIKVYDKQGSVLRVETTIVHSKYFKVYRPAETQPGQPLRWQILRRGVADLWRRGQVSQAANRRYLEALSSVTGKTPLRDEAARVCRAIQVKGRAYRALNPWSPTDAPLLEAISRGEFTVHGFRNRDLRGLLFTGRATRSSNGVTAPSRLLALLRAHGLIHKVSGTHRYQLTESGRRIVTALLAARNADVDQLTQLAA